MIRWAIRRDLPDILDIESQCFTNPWSEKYFITQLRKRNCIGMVAESGDRVVGCVIYELFKLRIEIVKLAVHPEFQRLGVGRELIEKLHAKLSPERRNRITMLVSERNLGAQLFLRAAGFELADTLRQPGQDDIYRFVLRYGSHVFGRETPRITSQEICLDKGQ